MRCGERLYDSRVLLLFAAPVVSLLVTMGLSLSGKQAPAAVVRRLALSTLGASPEEAYQPLRKTPELFETFLRDEWLAPTLMQIVEAARRGEKHTLLRKETEGIYSFDVFTEEFCRKLLDEVDNYFDTGLPVRRPNSMNNYGLIVNEIGMKPALTEFQQSILLPIAKLLWPEIGNAFHNHHSFMVQYRANEDAGLDMIVTAARWQCGQVGAPNHRQYSYSYQHVKGRAVMHLGTRRHGADDIMTGTRRNLIVWNHNLEYRRSPAYSKRMYNYQKESDHPDRRCLSFTHDRDYPLYKDYKPGAEEHAVKAWCPPPFACYDTMGAELRGHRKRGPIQKKN